MYELFFSKLNEKIAFSPEEQEIVKGYLTPKKLRKRQYLLQEGDICKSIAFVDPISGIERLFSSERELDIKQIAGVFARSSL